jgi:endogenous inhibitor of DNA gyrase (YacG/DUF329 family)
MQRNLDEAEFEPRPCPICGKASRFAARPFCSKRCADIDLHRWLSGTYAIPAAPDTEEDEASAPLEGHGPEQK